ncbi:MAG: GNVR domain-containing protein [Crocinitomicaceae bacterium]|nr:GNVR domain-containing protein [Crocinitomicaceae bacterium]
MAKIKLDDQKIGFSSNEIYKDFSMFSLEHRIEAEVELIKSPIIIEQAIDSLSLDVQITRVGSLKETILYGNTPFQISYSGQPLDRTLSFDLSIEPSGKYVLKHKGKSVKGELDKPLCFLGDTLSVKKNELKSDKRAFDLKGNYQVRIVPRSQMIAQIASKIDVAAPDKETPIIRISYVDRNPKRAADIINAVCYAYINDFVTTKSRAASGTVDFIDQELASISKNLSNSEKSLESFKTSERVVNTKQETETGLREISQLRVDMINLEINERAMRDLQVYIDRGNYFSETAVNFGFGDLVLTELVKKLKMLNDEKIDKSTKFTSDSQQIKAIDTKISEIKRYIKEAVKRNLNDIQIRKQGIQQSYEIQSHMFDELPTREKEQRILERDFMINESVYNFLSKKRIEAAILANSMISFHRVIHPAVESFEPISPNRTLIKFVSGLLGLIGGIGFVYLRKLVAAKVVSREDIEKKSALPFAGVIRKKANISDFEILFRTFQMKHKLEKGSVVGICSSNKLEGKKYVASNLSNVIESYGYSCATVSFADSGDDEKDSEFVFQRNSQEIAEKLEDIRAKFDYTLFIAPPSTQDVLVVKVLELSNLGLFIFRANRTGVNCVQEPDNLMEEYNLKNLELLLNGAHKATNYRGSYIGTRFTSQSQRKPLITRLRNYYNVYMK